MAKQRTIGVECEYKGIGLHTGCVSTVRFKPASEDFGIQFIRVDLPGNPRILANIKNVVGTVRGTTIGIGEVKIHTIEHIMSSLHALKIDNLIIEIDSLEPPVGDGSAFPFVEILKKAGIVEQSKEKKYVTLSRPLEFKKNDSEFIFIPFDDFKISCTISYNHKILGTEFLSLDINENSFENEISKSRTFCFDYEIEYMQKEGLAKGGSLDNAIVIGENRIHNKTPLRYKDEFVRHKILDLIGDLYLLGKEIKGHIVAVKCGHAMNVEFVKSILEEIKKSQNVDQVSSNEKDEGKYLGEFLNVNDIMKIIPHRYPFLLIDKAYLQKEKMSAIGFKNLSINEAFFQGHYPNNPIMPGVLIVEAMAQTSCLIFLSREGLSDKKIPLFMGINEVKFRKPVVPGDQLRLEVNVTRARERGGKLLGKAFVKNNLVAEAEIMFSLVNKN